MAKYGAMRQRPCFHYGKQNYTELSLGYFAESKEEFVSFFSGDATIAFVTFASGLVLAKLRGRSYARASPEVLKGIISPMALIGGSIATLGACLRLVSFMHWATDVLTGIFVGSLCGFLPYFLFFKPQAQCEVPNVDGGDYMRMT